MAPSSGPAIVDSRDLQRSYKRLALKQSRLDVVLGSTDLNRLAPLISEKRELNRGEMLFRQGDAARSLYIVRAGSLKTFVIGPAGSIQVLGFHLPSELLGFGGLGRDRYLGNAEALEHAHVWAVPMKQSEAITSQMPHLHWQLMQILGRWSDDNANHLVMMGRMHARERLAMFLRSFVMRNQRLSRDPDNLLLPMSRRDLANYLGLAMETVSRLFGQFQTDGVIAVDGKRVRVLRPELLDDLCGGD